MNFERLLVLCPHIDDESFGPGGLIAQVNARGSDVLLAVFSHGGAGIKFDGEKYLPYETDTRFEEFYTAVKMLGGATMHFFQQGDDLLHHRLDTVPTVELAKFIELCILDFAPTTLLLPFPSYDQDHRAVYLAGQVAARPQFFSGTVLSYCVGSEMHFSPDVFVRLDDEAQTSKIAAINHYRTQLQGMPVTHPCSAAMARMQMQRWGSMCGVSYAEGFVCERIVR